LLASRIKKIRLEPTSLGCCQASDRLKSHRPTSTHLWPLGGAAQGSPSPPEGERRWREPSGRVSGALPGGGAALSWERHLPPSP